MNNFFNDKTVMVTGSCGTVGSELVSQLLNSGEYAPKKLIGIDNSEVSIFSQDQKYLNDHRAYFYLVDVRDRDEISRKMEGVDIVFHCAALKHVVICERSPEQAISTNIQAVQNIISAAEKNKVEKVIFTSSDKAVNPTNVMGTSKLMGERLMTAANSGQHGIIFSSTRFGNVLGSSGSVFPIFLKQISLGGPVTLTHSEMTRFVMSVECAVQLIIDSALRAIGGEVFITKMPVIRIADLAQAMINSFAPHYGHDPKNIIVQEIGIKPGEKLYEELMSSEEIRRTVELEDYFAVLPAFRGMFPAIKYKYENQIDKVVVNPYISSIEQCLSVPEIHNLLIKYGLFPKPKPKPEVTDEISSRYWPGDKESGP
jgi:FlaA1/EpsC-like NDP-sugar epimerase